MIKQNKTKLLLVLSIIFFVCIAFAACNNKESEKTVTTESVTTPVKTDSLPVRDSMDTGEVKPTPTPN